MGFTLIELLVVISIIGMLSSIVLAALRSARDKAGDAAIKEEAAQLRNVSGLFLAGNNSFYPGAPSTPPTNICATFVGAGIPLFDYSGFQSLIQYAEISAGYVGNLHNSACYFDKNYWLVVISLKTNPLNSFCVNSLNEAKVVNASINQYITKQVTSSDTCDTGHN